MTDQPDRPDTTEIAALTARLRDLINTGPDSISPTAVARYIADKNALVDRITTTHPDTTDRGDGMGDAGDAAERVLTQAAAGDYVLAGLTGELWRADEAGRPAAPLPRAEQAAVYDLLHTGELDTTPAVWIDHPDGSGDVVSPVVVRPSHDPDPTDRDGDAVERARRAVADIPDTTHHTATTTATATADDGTAEEDRLGHEFDELINRYPLPEDEGGADGRRWWVEDGPDDPNLDDEGRDDDCGDGDGWSG